MLRLIILTLTATMTAAHSQPVEISDSAAAGRALKGQVVQIETTFGLGSGFWLGVNGLAVTCFHVASGNIGDELLIKSSIDALFDLPHNNFIDANWQVTKARIVAQDKDNDLAIIQAVQNPFSAPPPPFTKVGDKEFAAHFASAKLNGDLPEQGAKVYLSGYPLGQAYMIIQEGTVASVAFNLPPWGRTVKILVSTFSNHGNSGSPIFNKSGEVIGVLEGEDRSPNLIQERTGISVAVPAFYVQKLAGTVAQ
jgi:S1-C subfamily serine protease